MLCPGCCSAQTRRRLDQGTSEKIHCDVDPHMSQVRHQQMNGTGNEDKSSIAKLFEQGSNKLCHVVPMSPTFDNLSFLLLLLLTRISSVAVGLQKILSLLEAEDPEVRIHAVKVVANLAAEGTYLAAVSKDCFAL